MKILDTPIRSTFRLMQIGLCSLLCVASAHAAAAKNLHVLAIHSYSQEYPWTKGQHRGFVARLQRVLHDSAQLGTEYLDTKRRAWTPEYGRFYADFIVRKYDPTGIDAIYVTDDNALRFALDHLNSLLADVPVFFSGVNDFGMLKRLEGRSVTGVFERKEVLPNIDLLQRFTGNGNELIVVGDASNTYAAIAAELRAALAQRPAVKAQYVSSNNSGEIRAKLAERPDTPVLLTTLGAIRSEAGETLMLPEIIARIRSATHAIIISMEDAYLLPGVQGGFVTSSEKQGETAAELLLAWWSGTALQDLPPVLGSPNEYIFNESELDKLGLRAPGDLLAKARIIEPHAGFFERNQSVILSVLVLLSGALIFAVFLLIINLGVRSE